MSLRIGQRGRERAALVRSFAAGWLTHRKDRWAGEPFILEDWQYENIVLPIYGRLDRRGKRRYDKALIGLPRWNGKDETAALLALHHLFLEPVPDGECYAVAASRAQAAILFDTARKMVNANPELAAACNVYRHEIEVKETGCVFRCLPHDADTAQGFHPSFCVVDELHVHKDRRMLDAMLTGMAGREEPLLIVITTAGEQRRGVWWEVRKEWREDPSAYVYWKGAADDEDARDPKVWRAANPASWVSEERLAKLYRSLPLASWERYHLNRAPAHGANRVFEPERWRACSARPHIDPERPCVLGVDASQRRDHTAVVLDQMDEEGRHNVICFAFAAEEEGEIMSAIDTDAVGELIRELCASYNVTRIPCDRAYNVRLMGQLLAEGLPIEEFAQSDQNMTRACQRLFDAVAEERVRHGGDEVLEEYVLNAAVKTGRQGGFRFTKPDAEAKIDGAIALAMAVDVAEAEAGQRGIGVMVF